MAATLAVTAGAPFTAPVGTELFPAPLPCPRRTRPGEDGAGPLARLSRRGARALAADRTLNLLVTALNYIGADCKGPVPGEALRRHPHALQERLFRRLRVFVNSWLAGGGN